MKKKNNLWNKVSNKNKKILIILASTLLVALIIFATLIIVRKTKENIVIKELNKINELDVATDEIDMNIKSSGELKIVEEAIKNYYKDYDKKDNVCFWNYKSDSDAFLKGSSICIYENDHYSVYQCDGEWSYKSECNNCSQTGILIGKNWRPDGWTYPRNLYNLTALCIPDNYGLHCENDSIQFRFINNTTITIADCTSIGRKCELDSDGKPHCK